MRLVDSDGSCSRFFLAHFLNRDSECRRIIEVRQVVFPGTIEAERLYPIGDQSPPALASMGVGVEVMPIAEGTLDRVGTRTVGW